MLHATSIRDGKASFRNRFVRNEVVKDEMRSGISLVRPIMDSDPFAMIMNVGLNNLFTGSSGKNVANTNVMKHAGKFYALVDSSKPSQISLSSLETVGTDDFGGKLDFNFTAHPKKDAETGELVFFGSELSMEEPFCRIGVINADGELVRKTDVSGLKIARLMHDFAITSTQTILLDIPLVADLTAVGQGEKPIQYNPNKPLRMGILPRYC